MERDGIIRAPYFGKLHWVGLQRWDALSFAEWKHWVTRAHGLTSAKLSKRTLEVLAMTPGKRAQAIRERKKVLAARAEAKTR